QRVGMTVFRWAAADVVKPAGDPQSQHPKIFVSVSTHGHYLGTVPSAHVVTPFWGDNDPARRSCGVVETADDVLSGETIAGPEDPRDGPSTGALVAKIFLVAVGWVWAIVEAVDSHFGSPAEYQTVEETGTDVTGGPTFGVILRPNGLPLSEAAASM